MNLEDSDSFKEEIEKNSRNRKGIMLSIVLCAFLIALLFVMIMVIKYQDSITLKMYLDEQQISIPADFYRDIDGIRYINIKELGSLLGYKYTKGVYGEYNEDEDSCYLENDFEVLAITSGSSKYTKYIQITAPTTLAEIEVTSKNSNGYSESFKMENPVIYEDGMLYASLEYIPEMFNIQIDWQEYRIKFYSLNYIVNYAKGFITKYGVSEISGYYENLRALAYGYAIVGNGTEGVPSDLYGVISLNDGSEIISTKYDDIVFVQNAKEFYITVANGTVGILNNEGGTIIAPSEFEEISLLDEDNQLYLVKKGNEYGVLDRNGNIIVYAENDEIGIDITDYKTEEIENEYLLFGKCIPVLKNKKYGLYNIYGDIVLDSVYDGFGYKSTATSSTSGNEQSVLIIPSEVGINGIVVNYNDLYGIYDVNTEALIFPCVATKIYAITRSGTTTYYVEYNDEQIVLKDWLKENGLNNVDNNGQYLDEEEDNEDTSNETTNKENENTVNEDDVVETVSNTTDSTNVEDEE